MKNRLLHQLADPRRKCSTTVKLKPKQKAVKMPTIVQLVVAVGVVVEAVDAAEPEAVHAKKLAFLSSDPPQPEDAR